MGILAEPLSVGDGSKTLIYPKNFYFASNLTEAQIGDFAPEVDGKPRLESEETLISNLYLCLGEKGQDELKKRGQI